MKFFRLYIFVGFISLIIIGFVIKDKCCKSNNNDTVIRANELTRELSLDSQALKKIYENV
jgi:hypothetical protein